MQPPYRHCVPATAHAVPHVPQFFASAFRLTHAPPQTVWPAGHEHWLPAHEAPVGQALPQVPQCWGFVVMSTHWLFVPHGPCPVGQRHPPIQQD
jgi:hypothetical protein